MAIDIGGTFIKVAEIDEGVVKRARKTVMPAFIDSAGGFNDQGYAREFDQCLFDEAIFSSLEKLRPVSADGKIFVSGQMAGLAFTDEEGFAQAPIISWQDTRVHDSLFNIDAFGEDALALTGEKLRAGLPLLTLSGIERPPGSRITSLIGYAAGRIAGGRAHYVHNTDAASWGMLDLSTNNWSAQALSVLGIFSNELPEVTSEIIPVSKDASVYVAIGDQQTSLLGAGFRSGWLSVNMATGCQVSLLSNDFDRSVTTRPYFGEFFGGRFLRTITHLPAGRFLGAIIEDVCGSRDWGWFRDAGWRQLLEPMQIIVDSVCAAARKIGGEGLPIQYSGGLIEKVPWLQDAISNELRSPKFRIAKGPDASLSGLAKLANQL